MADLEVLISCMNLRHDDNIVSRSAVTSDAVVINQDQSELDYYYERQYGKQRIRVYRVNDKGLTKSRNLAIEKAQADICVLCDDDEVFSENYEQRVLKAYEELADADIIIFDMVNRPCGWGDKIKKLGYFDLMRVSSWQISFKRSSLISSGVRFDENMGAGSGNGAEEEFKFLTDCRKAKLTIYYYPFKLASVAQEQSTWFSGFDKTFFVNRGNTTRYIMGFFPAVLYAMYYAFAKKRQFKDITAFKAFSYMLDGIRENRLSKLKKGK